MLCNFLKTDWKDCVLAAWHAIPTKMSGPIYLSCGCFSRLFAWKIKVLIKSMAQIGTESVFWYHLKLNVQASLLGIFHPINMTFISLSIFPSNCSISKGYGLTDYTVFQALRTKDKINLKKKQTEQRIHIHCNLLPWNVLYISTLLLLSLPQS